MADLRSPRTPRNPRTPRTPSPRMSQSTLTELRLDSPERPCKGMRTPCAPRTAQLPPMGLALIKHSADMVRKAIQDDPEAVSQCFMDHHCEPPMCCALRVQSSVEIVKLLIENGADVHATDMMGRTPLIVLCTVATTWPNMVTMQQVRTGALDRCQKQRQLAVAAALVDAGANPWQCDTHGRNAIEICRKAGIRHLVRFLQHHREVRACAVLRRLAASSPIIGHHCDMGQMPPSIYDIICSFLAPADEPSTRSGHNSNPGELNFVATDFASYLASPWNPMFIKPPEIKEPLNTYPWMWQRAA